DVDPVDLGHELGEGVEARLEPPEVVVLGPVPRELPEERDLHALRGVLDELVGGPARRLDAAAQIVDLLLRDLDREGPDPCCSLGCGAHDDLPLRSGLKAARSSAEKSSGSSQAAKWPPLSTSLK